MLKPSHESTSRFRARNIGASTVLTSVSPVLPSLPQIGTLCLSASSWSAGTATLTEGVKFTYGNPRSSAAYA